jgi:lysozyme
MPAPVKIPTVCYGETNVAMRVYSRDECGTLLRHQLARKYAPPILKCIPGLVDPARRNEFAAMIDSSYNAGPVAVCKSPAAQHMRAGRYKSGCTAIRGWYTTARDRRTGQRIRLRGLVIRRNHAADLCLRPEAA